MGYALESYIEEQKGTENTSYILKQDAPFFMTGYKVLQSKENRGLVKCGKLRFNGKIKLVYFSAQYMSLQTIINYLDSVSIKTILRNLMVTVLKIKENGFLRCENIDTRPEKIFIDRATLEVFLVYLPIKMDEGVYNKNIFENELRVQLIKLLNSSANSNGEDIKEIVYQLSNGSVSLEQLCRFLQESDGGYLKLREQPRKEIKKNIILKSRDGKIIFDISKEEFTIGKKAELVDGVISGNAVVSRSHCKVIKKNNEFCVMDLGSANGTFVDGKKLIPNKPVKIDTGTRIRIANLEFQVI